MAGHSEESFASVSTLGGALHRALKQNAADTDGAAIPIKEHPGNGLTVLDLGMTVLTRRGRTMELRHDVIEAAQQRARHEYAKGEALCESPIERAMLAGLLTAQWSGFDAIPPAVHVAMDKEEMLPDGDIVIVPQMAFLRYRLDFGIVLRLPSGFTQTVAVECDGADFHTEYRKEALRINYLKSWGIPVFKFTGKEIHADALAVAAKVAFGVCQWRAAL